MSAKLKLAIILALSFTVLPGLAFASAGEISSAYPGAERILVTSDGGLAVYSSAGALLSGFPVWAEGVFGDKPLAVKLRRAKTAAGMRKALTPYL